MSRQIGAKKVDFELRGSGMGAPCHAGWLCHPEKQEMKGSKVARWQRAPLVNPGHLRFHIVIWGLCSFSLFFSLENGNFRVLISELLFLISNHWIEIN